MTLRSDLEYFNSLDRETQLAVIAIHLVDLQDQGYPRSNSNGECVQSQKCLPTTEHVEEVQDLVMKEIEDARQFDGDQAMARSMTTANFLDAQAIRAARSNERANDTDAGDDIRRNGPALQYSALELATSAGIFMGEQAGKDQYISDYQAEHDCSREEAIRVTEETFPHKDCVVCREQKSSFELFDLACTHSYCQSCVQDLFAASFKDESLFPPRCCRNNKFEGFKLPLFIPKHMRDEFAERKIEFETKDRTYCHVQTCSAFIPVTSASESRMQCPKCSSLTCSRCKEAFHTGACPDGEEAQAVEALAANQGWRRCDHCKNMVELAFGCNHVTCRCRHEFCYVCGQKWKTCTCPHWDEGRLLARAQGIANRDRGLDQARRAARVQEAANNLRERHECEHEQYQWIAGRHRCEQCNDILTRFIFRCQQCEIQVCWRCRHNRL